MTRIAIVALNAYPAINPQAAKNVGGLENFAWTFARALAATSDWRVSLLLRHPKPIPEETCEGVRFVKFIEPLRNVRLKAGRCIRRNPRFPFLKIKHWEASLLWQIPLLAIVKLLGIKRPHHETLQRMLAESDPEIVVALGVSSDSTAAIQAAKALGKPIWLWLRSNGDIDERFFSDDSFVDPYAVSSAECRYCINEATGILCQTQWQADRLKQLTSRGSVIVRNPVDLNRFPQPLPTYNERDTVLWVGRMDRFHKRPLLAIEIARRCPEIPFLLIANRSDAAVEAEVRATCPPNVTLLDYVPRNEIGSYYQRARLFLSTGASAYEGFPNVFLESAACCTPIVALEDFDEFLKTTGCGISTQGDVAQAALTVQRFWKSATEWQVVSDQGRQSVEKQHSLAAFVAAFRDALRQ